MKIWRLEWPDGSGAYRGSAIESLLPPCYQVFDQQWNTTAHHPAPINDPKLHEAMDAADTFTVRRYKTWHFGFASRAAFDAWFDPANLSFVNSPQCAGGLLQVACYEVPAQHVICGDYQAVFNPKHAERGECQQLGSQSLSSGTATTAV